MIAGIDIGGTTSKIGLVRDGHIVGRARIATTGHSDEHAFADALARETLRMGQEIGASVTAVGIGAPNANQLTGVIEMAPNLPWKNEVPLARMMEDRLGVPCVLGNDANAAALGEWRYGAGRGIDDLLVVTLGTGVGSGFIIGGRLVLGSAGNAGELGHTILYPEGRPCTCGRRGCLEAYVSIRGIRRTYAERSGTEDGHGTLAREGVLPIAEAARQNDPHAQRTFHDTVDHLAIGLANAVCFSGSRRIVLFGGIARNGDLIMAPLRDRFAARLLNIYQGRVDLMASALPEDDAALLGAAALVDPLKP